MIPAGRTPVVVARIAVGPLALAAFFLPWWAGQGLLAGRTFSAHELLTLTGNIPAADAPGAETAAAWAIRIGLFAFAVAASWQTVLAPVVANHRAYRWSGWALVALALTLAVGLQEPGAHIPPAGMLLACASGALFAACELHRARPRLGLPLLQRRAPREVAHAAR